MQVAHPKRDQLRAELKKFLVSRLFWLHIILLLTLPFWVFPLTYLWLRSFLFDPDGIIAWSVASFLIGSFVVFDGVFIYRSIKYGRELGRARVALRDGELYGPAWVEQAKFEYKKQCNVHLLGVGHMALVLAIPAAVALTIWQEIGEPDVIRMEGKSIGRTGRARLEGALKGLEERGIFKPYGSD